MSAKRPRAELIQLLAHQRAALAASCANYDNGNEWESARLATAIFTLVHDGGSITSILTQLGIRGSLRFVCSAPEVNRNNLAADSPLVMFSMQQTPESIVSKALPLLDRGPPYPLRRVHFQHWWADDLIYRDDAFELTRRRLVFALRHQDGGGHVGPLTDEAYVRMKTKVAARATVTIATRQSETHLFVLNATTRQVAWELTKTLDDYGPI